MSDEQSSGQDKTEEPTDKRKKDFREKGQVAQSKDLASVGVLLAVMLGFALFGGRMSQQLQGITIEYLTSGAAYAESYTNDPTRLLKSVTFSVIDVVAPVLAIATVAGLFLAICQVGINWSWKPLTPEMSRFDPIKGLQNKLFSAQAVAEWLKSMGKVVVVAAVSYHLIKGAAPKILELADYSLGNSVAWTCIIIAKLVGYVLLFMLIVSIGDYMFQFYQTHKKMKMTMQELKEETKEQEGDPFVRARVKAIMQEASRNRLVADMADATVVISNPTHYAVAVKYDIGQPGPPILVARGLDNRAQLIKEIARSNGTPRVENRPLARALYAQCKAGDEIPGGLYEAVAEVLAFVYRLRADQGYLSQPVSRESGTGLA